MSGGPSSPPSGKMSEEKKVSRKMVEKRTVSNSTQQTLKMAPDKRVSKRKGMCKI